MLCRPGNLCGRGSEVGEAVRLSRGTPALGALTWRAGRATGLDLRVSGRCRPIVRALALSLLGRTSLCDSSLYRVR